MNDAAYWVKILDLRPHPEGGYYRRTYESADRLPAGALSARFPGERPVATAILYLLESPAVSALHRIQSDEIWHFCLGSPLRLTVLHPGGRIEERILGADPAGGQSFQHAVRAGSWFGGEVVWPQSFSLVGCVVAPGFDFEDFELADRTRLLRAFPQHRALIERLTRW